MEKRVKQIKVPEWVKQINWSASPELEPVDWLYFLGVEFDLEAQLLAVGGLLRRNREAEKALDVEIRRIEEHTRRLSGMHAEWAVDDWVDEIHRSAYQGAAHSMSALGMLAPLVETIFYQCFRGIGDRFYPNTHPSNKHERWAAPSKLWWDCHKVVVRDKGHKDLLKGVLQLADAIGLTDRLPADLELTLSALFGYRNKMFHHGLEWPVKERKEFAERMKCWPADWFSKASEGDTPWIFYLSDNFIAHCLTTIEKVVTAFGDLVRDDLLRQESAS